MIRLETRVVLRPGVENDFLREAWPYMGATRAEPGCIRVEIYACVGDAEGYVFEEIFRDKKAFDKHLASEHTHRHARMLEHFAASKPRVESFRSVMRAPPPPKMPPPRERPAWEGATREAPESRGAQTRKATPQLVVRLDALELAKAHDGLFSGDPDPCILVGAYALQGQRQCVLGRSLLRIRVTKDAPCVVEKPGVALDIPVRMQPLPSRIVVLAVALEESDGRGVQRAYQELEWVEELQLWRTDTIEPHPVPMMELLAVAPEQRNECESVEVLARGEPLSSLVQGDTWVGASVLSFTPSEAESSIHVRFHFAADPTENDWVAIATSELTLGTTARR
jgi:quinol monooxygenase YgiN